MPVAADVEIVWNEGAVELLAHDDDVAAMLDMLAGRVLSAMKAACPVSPIPQPVPGDTFYGGDFPARPSGYLRSSCRALREPDGSIIIGPTAPYALYVQNGTPPHGIDSHGSWPLRNPETGQIFGRHVNHLGAGVQPFITSSLVAIVGAVVEV
jgi:hypothetical protein